MDKYKLITIKELNILFLEYKYSNVKTSTFSSYQFRARVVNEYFGDTLVINIDLLKIKKFKIYLYSRKWEYSEKGSENSINQIMNYLYQILMMAEKWKIIDKVELKNNQVFDYESVNFVENRNKYLINNELKRASNQIDNILNV